MKLSAFTQVNNEVMGGNLKEFLQNKKVVVFDLENDALLPTLKKGWVAVATDYHTGETKSFILDDYSGIVNHISNYDVIAGHNLLGYDLFALKKLLSVDFSVLPDSFNGKDVYIFDTLVASKLLNPDRIGGHSLEAWGEQLGEHKLDFKEFHAYSPAMLIYCQQDVKLNVKVLDAIVDEWGDHDWWDSYELEKAVWEIITRQELYGFPFNVEKATKAVQTLDKLLLEAENIVTPKLPKRPLAKSNLKNVPARKFKNDKKHESGKVPSADMVKYFGEDALSYDKDMGWLVTYPNGEVFRFQDAVRPLITHEDMPISDTRGIKEFIMDAFKWEPTAWKEKDLTLDDKKQKLSQEKFIKRVNAYCDECLLKYPTLGTFRAAHTKSKGIEDMRAKLLRHDTKRPLKVITQPLFNTGQDKEELCPNLERLGESVSFVKELILWLTYRHRRNFLLSPTGNTGLLIHPRLAVDGRLPTPADTLGCNTGRFQHKIVANVPRVSSIFGAEMRELFEADEDKFFIGCDADALEARIEGHYTYKYTGGKAYAEALTAEKPNDTHTVRAKNLGITRDEAKKLKYSCTYGAQPRKVSADFGWDIEEAQDIFDRFWEDASPLKNLKLNLIKHWKTNDKKWIRGLDGRKLATRSEHSILNTLFQSGGVIAMKRAMVMWDKWVKAENLSVRQLIAYHDEQDCEDDKKNFKFKIFSTKEEAQEWKAREEAETGLLWSDVLHSNKGYYVSYNRGGELSVKSILEGGNYYNLNVSLTSGYMVGRNWGECH